MSTLVSMLLAAVLNLLSSGNLQHESKALSYSEINRKEIVCCESSLQKFPPVAIGADNLISKEELLSINN